MIGASNKAIINRYVDVNTGFMNIEARQTGIYYDLQLASLGDDRSLVVHASDSMLQIQHRIYGVMRHVIKHQRFQAKQEKLCETLLDTLNYLQPCKKMEDGSWSLIKKPDGIGLARGEDILAALEDYGGETLYLCEYIFTFPEKLYF